MITLCDSCKRCISCNITHPGEYGPVHHFSLDSLKAAITLKCWICNSFKNTFTHQEWETLLTPGKAWEREGRKDVSTQHLTQFYNVSRSRGDSVHPFQVWLTFNEVVTGAVVDPRVKFDLMLSENLSGIQTCRVASSSTGSMEAWQVAVDWIRRYTLTHKSCNEHAALPTSLPTRVIDVADRILPPTHVRLVLTRQEQILGKYVTLSHCWGHEQFFVLTRENLSRCLKGIVISDLNKTFQEAIEITRRAGARYLWIDSLCIVQGSSTLVDDDWIVESKKMAEYYGHAWLNISATASSKGSEGLFRDRDPAEVEHQEVKAPVLGASNKIHQYLEIEPTKWRYAIVNATRWKGSWTPHRLAG